MTCSIFLKSYSGDYEWAKYCLRSIAKFASGFDSVIVVTDRDQPKPPVGTLEQWFTVRVRNPGYQFQQVCKMNADAFTPSQFVLYQDSDTIFTQPISPSDVIVDGKPVWLYESYEGMTNPDVLVRRAVVSAFVGVPVEHEFMRRHPFVVSREQLADLRRFCWRQHGVSLDDYMMETKDISEFNFLGAFLWSHQRSSVIWRKPEEMPTYVWQGWSHGGLTEAIRADLEKALT